MLAQVWLYSCILLCFYSIIDLLVLLVVVPLVKVGFDDVDTEDAEEVDERWS